MKRLTLKFQSLADVANFTKTLQSGYIINTVLFTATGLFTQEEVDLLSQRFAVTIISSIEVMPSNSVNPLAAYPTMH
ncbi:MAG: hypothetical protein WKF70_00345 [Chitinophagaceae bacterium]